MARELVVREEHEDTAKKKGPGVGAYLRPWLMGAAMWPAGWAAHAMWGEAGLATGLAAAGIGAAGMALTTYTYRLTRARTWIARRLMTGTVGASATWLTAATVVGTGRPLVDIGIVVGGGLALLSNIHTKAAAMGGDDGGDAAGPPPITWAEAAEKVGLKGVKARITSNTKHRTIATLRLTPGQTADELTGKLKQLASVFGVASHAVRVVEDPEDAAKAELTIIKKDLMKELVPWPGLVPERSAMSIADAPLELGVYEDGTVFTDEVNNRHSLTMGMAGSGKSVYGKCKIVQVAQRNDTFVVAVDLAKGKQTLGPIEPALGWGLLRTGANTKAKKEAREVLAAIKRAVGARADYLGEKGLSQWQKGCGLTFVFVVIEEASLLVDFDEIVELAAIARSTGIHLNLSLQRASWGNVDTDARANLGDGVCFGVRDAADAGFALPDHVTDAGAAPDKWGKTRPGAFFGAVEAQPPENHTTPIKSYGPPSADPDRENELLAPAAEEVGDQDAKLDPVTRAAFGKPYADYLAARRGQQQEKEGAAPAPVPVAADEHDQEPQEVASAAGSQEVSEMDDGEEPTFTTPDPDPDLVAGIDDVIEVAPERDFTIPRSKKGTKASAEEAKAMLEAQLAMWADQGQTTFAARELGMPLDGVRGRSWVYDRLEELETAGRLVHEDSGEWTIVVGELAAA